MGYEMILSPFIAFWVAGLLKVPIHRLTDHEWKWGLVTSTGGMPSSHSATVSALALAVGLFDGFTSAGFAISMVLAGVVLHDAVTIRRQAGMQAARINIIFDNLLAGHALTEKDLKEVLGHTPFEVAAGVGIGLLTAFLVWLF
jgi:acid phosphatase family membrane protein YuiD